MSSEDTLQRFFRCPDCKLPHELQNELPSHCPITKAELHINRRPYDEWDALFRHWFSGTVTRLKNRVYVSEGWRIDLP